MELVDINRDNRWNVRPDRCRCPNCGLVVNRAPNAICSSLTCPRCGSQMERY